MRVLIAEDNEAFRDILSVVLRGHEVIVAEDGAEAVEMAQCYRPDIVLMDVLMPEMDGFMALERLKADEATAGIPVVLMSAGCTNAHYAERGLSLGAADYLKKPFDILGLPKLLEGYVAKKKARDGTRTHLQLAAPNSSQERSYKDVA